MKICKRCGLQEKFYIRTDLARAKYDPCIKCMLTERRNRYAEDKEKYQKRAKRYRLEYPEKMRDRKLRQTYGVGLEYFNAKLEEQGGVCAGCRRNVPQIWMGKKVAMALDHDHILGKPRGVLCRACNVALGALEDNLETLKHLMDYIRKYQK